MKVDQDDGLSLFRRLWWRFTILVAAMILGALVSLVAMAFFWIFDFFSSWWVEPLPVSLSFSEWQYRPVVGIALLTAALIAGLLILLLKEQRPHGPADLIEAAQNDRLPDLRQGFLSSLLALVNLSGGASVGIFGPLVHLGGCVSAALRKFFIRLPKDLILGLGAGAAIAAVFSAPIGAAIMAHEMVMRRFSTYGPAPVLVASFSAYWVSTYGFGHEPFFSSLSADLVFTGVIFLQTIALGVVSGVVAMIYIWSVTTMPRVAQATGIHPLFRPLVPAVLLFLLSPLLPHLLGPGLSTMQLALAGQLSLTLLLVLVLAKIFFTSLCLGFGFFGGVFAPALFIGLMLGGALDQVLLGMGSDGVHFAIVGAASVIAAVIGAPIAAVVIIFELSGSYQWAVLSMISVMVASQITRATVGRSLFDRQLHLRGIKVYDDHPPTKD